MIRLIKYLAFLLFAPSAAFTQSHGDVVINEILFNPSKDGYDYIELFNRTETSVFLGNLLIANRNVTGDLAGFRNIAKDSAVLAPKSYALLTPNEKWLKLNYKVPLNALVIPVSSLPSFPDDEGHVVLVRKIDSLIIDELHYKDNWHFNLINDPSGVSLERIDPDYPTQDDNNWSSASFSSGFGTPGYQNSQFKSGVATHHQVSVMPAVISPDNNGIDDFATVEINAADNGYVANAVIYDATGTRIRYLVKNAVLGAKNRFKWDGYDDQKQRVPTGIYILFTQIFDIMGNTSKYRNCIVLDSRVK